MADKKVGINEIRDDELKSVSGGAEKPNSIACPNCGGKMQRTFPALSGPTNVPKYICPACRHAQW